MRAQEWTFATAVKAHGRVQKSFGVSRRGGTAVIAIGIVILWALWPIFVTELAPPERLATVAPPSPLQAITRTSQVIAPVAIALYGDVLVIGRCQSEGLLGQEQ